MFWFKVKQINYWFVEFPVLSESYLKMLSYTRNSSSYLLDVCRTIHFSRFWGNSKACHVQQGNILHHDRAQTDFRDGIGHWYTFPLLFIAIDIFFYLG